MRSSDFYLGFPTNIAFSSLWLCIFCKLLKYDTGQVFYTASDVHVYDNQIETIIKLISKYTTKKMGKPNFCKSYPRIKFLKDLNSLDDIFSLEWEDIELSDFNK